MYKGKDFISEIKDKPNDALRKMLTRRHEAMENVKYDIKDVSKDKKKKWAQFIEKEGISKKRAREDHMEFQEEEKDLKKYKTDLEKEISIIEKEISSRDKSRSMLFSYDKMPTKQLRPDSSSAPEVIHRQGKQKIVITDHNTLYIDRYNDARVEQHHNTGHAASNPRLGYH